MTARLLFVLLLLAGGAAAQSPAASLYDRALESFVAGRFEMAGDLAAQGTSADAAALAARAYAAHINYAAEEKAEREATLGKALEQARLALKRDPDHVEARLQLAIALGYQARREGHFKAQRKGRAKAARALIEEAIALDPDNGWAYALLGGWSAEIEAEGGFLGRLIYGKQEADAIAAYEKALSLMPENPVLHFEFAKALLRMDASAHRVRAVRLLEQARDLPAENYVDVLAQYRARLLLTAVPLGKKDVRARIREMEPFLD